MASNNSNQPRFAIAILAAGKGTRLKSRLPKVLHEIGGRPLLGHVIAAASAAVAPSEIFCIIGHEAGLVRERIAGYGVHFVEQKEQRGTGHALMQCREALAGYDHVLVLSGDVPLIRTETIEKVRDFHLSRGAAMTVLTARPADPTGYGRIVRGVSNGANVPSEEIVAIVEQKQLAPSQLAIGEINSGIYAFDIKELFARIDRLSTDNPHAEYYLTEIAAILRNDGKKVLALEAADSCEVLGANTRAELAELDTLLRRRKVEALMNDGVTIFQPESCRIDAAVEVGPDTVIEPFVQLLGTTKIGANCLVRSFSVIENTVVADDVLIKQGCIFEDSTVGRKAILGPYSHLRPASEIGEEAHVGNFVETKKTKLGRGAKANHLTYLGDAEIGEGTNIGCGTITCNYDGVNKHRTVVGKNVFVGSDTTLVAPVTVGDGSYIGAASCITRDLPADSLGVTRPELKILKDWAIGKRARLKAEKEARTKK
jgi:bifunctional UDP-N-acetylglucosamine pyrophosphorylase/glucosamine-1-phosphate N-acetyltransferase